MTVKTLKDLPGLKDEHITELADLGIKTVADMKKALADEKNVKSIVKTLSGVGPKTVDKWKADLESVAGAKEEVEKPAKKDAKKGVEIVEEEEEQGYIVSIKPEIDDITADALAKRALINGNRPEFRRQEWFRYKKLGEKWRRPKGIHSKMKRNLKRRPPVVDIGYRGPKAARGLHPSGFEEVLVHNVESLDVIDPKKQAVRIGRTVGTKKRLVIEDRAAELNIRVLNRLV